MSNEFVTLQYMDADNKSILARRSDGTARYMQPGEVWWDMAVIGSLGDIHPYEPEPEPTAEELLDRERASMRCSPAQMRVALHRMGLLSQVQGIADGDAEASIVWEYATVIVRNSPFIDALSVGNFTPEEIDNIFNEAMAVVI